MKDDVMLYYRWGGLDQGYTLCHRVCKLLPNLFHIPSRYNRWDCSHRVPFTLCSELACNNNEINLKEGKR